MTSPYIVTMKRHPNTRGFIDYEEVSRVAVATLEEVPGKVCKTLLSYPNRTSPVWDALFTDALTIPESGGKVGPLPDGTVIEVERTTWQVLSAVYPGSSLTQQSLASDAERGDLNAQQRILDAFNAQKAKHS